MDSPQVLFPHDDAPISTISDPELIDSEIHVDIDYDTHSDCDVEQTEG